jgi:hypothetical protein
MTLTPPAESLTTRTARAAQWRLIRSAARSGTVRGGWFALRVCAPHILQDLCNGLSVAIGTALFFAAHYLGLRLPDSLATDAPAPSFQSRSIRKI